jgi:hypothetical protein
MSDFPRICANAPGYSFDQLDRDFARTMRPDAETIPGRDDLDPRDFIRPDGSYDVTPLNLPDESMRAHIETWRENKGAIR